MNEIFVLGVRDEITYYRHDPHHDPEPVTGNLLRLVYDIPYFGACGVFPPLHIANQWFADGGGDGGMSPGASWKPFTITAETYEVLVAQVASFDPADFEDSAEYFRMKFLFDSAFDLIPDRFEWVKAVCGKHRDGFHERARRQLSGA